MSNHFVVRRITGWLGVFTLSVGMLSGLVSCHQQGEVTVQSAPAQRTAAQAMSDSTSYVNFTPDPTHEGGLYFDERYDDSTHVHPRNARIQRQLAIETQFSRLGLARRRASDKDPSRPGAPPITSDSVFEGVSGGPLIGYASEQVLLADIYRKIDSLKVLEHIPLTPH